jgi:hypothetical protein
MLSPETIFGREKDGINVGIVANGIAKNANENVSKRTKRATTAYTAKK